MLTALIDRPERLIYLSSGLHYACAGSPGHRLDGGNGTPAADSESKLRVTALALTVARVWPEVLSNAVDPAGARQDGGPAATDDLE